MYYRFGTQKLTANNLLLKCNSKHYNIPNNIRNNPFANLFIGFSVHCSSYLTEKIVSVAVCPVTDSGLAVESIAVSEMTHLAFDDILGFEENNNYRSLVRNTNINIYAHCSIDAIETTMLRCNLHTWFPLRKFIDFALNQLSNVPYETRNNTAYCLLCGSNYIFRLQSLSLRMAIMPAFGPHLAIR